MSNVHTERGVELNTKYADKHFNKHQRNKIWSGLKGKKDVEMCYNRSENLINSVRETRPKDRIREDFIEIEETFGEIELALNKIAQFPDVFHYTEENLLKLKELFEDLIKQSIKLEEQSVYWH